MDLFSLVAKLTLDTKDYDKKVSTVENTSIKNPTAPKLELDNKEYVKSVDEAQEKSESFGGMVGDIFSGIKTALVATGIAAIVGKLTTLFAEGVNAATEMGDAVDKGSKRLGISTRTYQTFNHALQQSGGNINDISRGMATFRGIVTGTEEATEAQAAAFEKLGVSVKDGEGNMKSAEQVMQEVIQALAEWTDAGEDADTAGSIIDTLFGKNASGIKNLIAGGTASLRDLLNEADELGLVMTDQEIQNAVAYGDAMSNLQEELKAVKSSFVKDIIPYLSAAVKDVTAIVAFFNLRAGDSTLSSQLKNINSESEKSVAVIEGTSDVAMDLINKLFSMGEAEKLTAEQQKEWAENADWLIKNIPGLSAVIDTDTKALKGNKEELEAIVQNWRSYSIERAKAKALEDKIAAVEQTEAAYMQKSAEARGMKRQMDANTAAQLALARQRYGELSTNSSEWRTFAANGLDNITEEEWAQGLKNSKVSQVFNTLMPSTALMGRKDEAWSKLIEESKQYNEYWKLENEAEALAEEVAKGKKELEMFAEDVDASARELQERFGELGDSTEALEGETADLTETTQENNAANANGKGSNGSMIDYEKLYEQVSDAVVAGMSKVRVDAHISQREVTSAVNTGLAEVMYGRRLP